MDEASIIRYITDTFADVDVTVAAGDSYLAYNPGGGALPDRWQPFVTLVTSNQHDSVSQLDRPSVFRLNVGVSTDTYRSLFGPQPTTPGAEGVVDTGHDFAALDQIMPHPVYAPMSWVCVLNPSAATFEAVRPLLAEAYDLAVRRHAGRSARR